MHNALIKFIIPSINITKQMQNMTIFKLVKYFKGKKTLKRLNEKTINE